MVPKNRISFNTRVEIFSPIMNYFDLFNIALEVFCFDGQNQLLAFMKDTRTKVYQRFLTVSKSIADR